MEPLNLQIGHFLPRTDATDEERLRAAEAHLSGLTTELEYLLSEIGTALTRLSEAMEAAAASDSGGDV